MERICIYSKYGNEDRVVFQKYGMVLAGIILVSKFDQRANTFRYNVATDAGGIWVQEDEIITKTVH